MILSLVEPTVHDTLDTIPKMCSEDNGSSVRQCFNLLDEKRFGSENTEAMT